MTTYLPRQGLIAKRLGNELFLHDASGEELLVLNTTAMLIWSLCDGTHDVTQMLEVLTDLFPHAPTQELEKDLKDQLEEWVQAGVLAIHSS